MKRVIVAVLSVVFIAVIAYSGYQLWKINANYADEKKVHGMVMEYKPADQGALSQAPGEKIVNQSIIDFQSKYPDAIGWLTVPNTKIDYPFARAGDNDYYLRRDWNGNYLLAGTIFMDYRCNGDFTSPNTIIYGHHMKNGSMFGSLKLFNDKSFFGKNTYGKVYLPHETLTLEIFAYMVLKSNDQMIYSPEIKDGYLDYVKQNARNYRDIGLSDGDRVVTLSTCAYEFNNARMVLLAKIK